MKSLLIALAMTLALTSCADYSAETAMSDERYYHITVDNVRGHTYIVWDGYCSMTSQHDAACLACAKTDTTITGVKP